MAAERGATDPTARLLAGGAIWVAHGSNWTPTTCSDPTARALVDCVEELAAAVLSAGLRLDANRSCVLHVLASDLRITVCVGPDEVYGAPWWFAVAAPRDTPLTKSLARLLRRGARWWLNRVSEAFDAELTALEEEYAADTDPDLEPDHSPEAT